WALSGSSSMNLFRKSAPTPPGGKSTSPQPPGSAKPAPALLPRLPQSASEAEAGPPEAHDALRDLAILLHNKRLYHHTHPKNQDSLERAYASLEHLAQNLNGIELRIERNAIVIPKLNEAPVPDPKGELRTLASDFQLAGIQTLIFLRQFHVGELDTLA